MIKYKHNKTGKEYELISTNFMFKDCTMFTDEDKPVYEWRRELILYKALYDNPDGRYFARTPEDFYNNFTEITDNFIEKFYEWESDMLVTKDEWDIMAHNIEDAFDKNLASDPEHSKTAYLLIQKILTKLLSVDQNEIKKKWIDNYNKKS